MSITTLLEMAASAHPDRTAVGADLSYARLLSTADSAAAWLAEQGARSLAFVGVNGPHWPVMLFAAARAGIPVVALNYRLTTEALADLVRRLERPAVVADERYVAELATALGQPVTPTPELVGRPPADALPVAVDPDDPAVVLFTSGTTAEPKGVVLRHANLFSYVVSTVEFGSAGPAEAAIISVPPYHVAGVGTVLTNVYAGRRLIYLEDFTPSGWLRLVLQAGVTQAMLVPTMLARIVDHLGDRPADVPTLRSIAYGGAPIARPVLERALRLFPDVGFTNGYGLTETSSTVAVLGPEDHRTAVAATDPMVRERLSSVGRLVPGVEGSVRDADGCPVPDGAEGELWLRGEQVSGEYLGQPRDDARGGWFATRDRARFDADGYLFVLGRMDDTIIRGGENIAPAEIEAVLVEHPAVREAAVVGLPDDEWGQRTVAVVSVVPGQPLTEDEVRTWVRGRLRSSRTPDQVVFRTELPYSPMGKLLRRELVATLRAEVG